MLSVYADDSSDAKGERIFAVAGVMGTQEEWDTLEIDWITRTEGKIFHATDCESGYKDYKGIQKDQRLKEYKDLTQILVRSNMMGFGAVVNIEEYKQFTVHDLKEAPYFHCFLSVVFCFVKWTRLIIPQQKVKFVFDINHKVKYNAANLYDNYLVKRSEYKEYTSYMDRELGFATSNKVGIQVADLFSHEAMKHFDNLYFSPNKIYIRKSLNELLDTKRFKLRFYNKEYFEDFERRRGTLRRKDQKDYKQWLALHKCNNNAENRIRYLIYLESTKNSDS